MTVDADGQTGLPAQTHLITSPCVCSGPFTSILHSPMTHFSKHALSIYYMPGFVLSTAYILYLPILRLTLEQNTNMFPVLQMNCYCLKPSLPLDFLCG